MLVLSMGSGAGEDLPAFKGSLRQLRFSPNGRYVLAQDDSEATVLTVEPFTILFRIPAQNATAAQFTPDSRNVVFVSSATPVNSPKILFAKSADHVERWSIADRTRVESATLPVLVCGTEELSPDGAVLACLDLESTLRFVDVASGLTIFEEKEFTRLFRCDSLSESGPPVSFCGELGSARIDFSPDGRFVVVMPKNAGGSPLAWNARERTIVELTGPLKLLKQRGSAFIAPDRILIWNGVARKNDRNRGVANARVIEFPSGKLLSEPKIPNGGFFRATDPGFLVIRPFGLGTTFAFVRGEFLLGRRSPNRAAAVELSTGLVIISDTPALDVFGRFYVAEHTKGEVGLYEIGKGLKAAVVVHQK
jgi:hypothetical protein